MAIAIRVESWVESNDDLIVKYFTWDRVCLCTKESATATIKKPIGVIDKKSITIELLKLYKQ